MLVVVVILFVSIIRLVLYSVFVVMCVYLFWVRMVFRMVLEIWLVILLGWFLEIDFEVKRKLFDMVVSFRLVIMLLIC